jgi:hypothetical protein
MGKLLITLFLGWAGIHKFIEKKTVLGVVYFFTFGLFGIGWLIDVILAAKHLNNSQPQAKECILVVGEYYRHNDICSVLSGNTLYNLPDSEFIKKIDPDKRIYRYKYRKTMGQLIPEPTNQHDKNAIKVIVDNIHVGYVPAERCLDIKKRMSKIEEIEVHISGGDYKYHSRNEVYKSKDDFNIKIYL